MADGTTNRGDGTPARVAFDLWDRVSVRIRLEGETTGAYIQRQLKVYEQCLKAANGHPFNAADLT